MYNFCMINMVWQWQYLAMLIVNKCVTWFKNVTYIWNYSRWHLHADKGADSIEIMCAALAKAGGITTKFQGTKLVKE